MSSFLRPSLRFVTESFQINDARLRRGETVWLSARDATAAVAPQLPRGAENIGGLRVCPHMSVLLRHASRVDIIQIHT